MSTQDLINKLWNLCNVLRDDGVTYQEYINELTFLIFLKMVEETSDENSLPEGYRWEDLKAHNSVDRLEEYKKLLIHLGSHGSNITKAIFNNAGTVIRKPTTLTKLVTEIDKLDWYSAKAEGLGDMYEGLLEINATEKKSGAGQYFTPRVLIDVMVKLMKPNLEDVIVDPTAGTGGFLISAHHYMDEHNDILELNESAYKHYQEKTFFGMELVSDTHRLAMMNLMLHGLSVDGKNTGILYGDTLSNEGKQLPQASLVLANPPFGTKMGGGEPTRDDLVHYTSNKQLAFLHLIYHRTLKPGGRAAVILPDNVLFESGIGKAIRQDLMNKCNLHTILRLPTGIFYAAGVKTNVLFFSKPKDTRQDNGNTKKTWVYDLRSNIDQFGKRNQLTASHFDEFIECFGEDAFSINDDKREKLHKSLEQDQEESRFRCYTREEIKEKEDSLDLTWIRDENNEDAADLPAPDVLINETVAELAGAIEGLNDILKELKEAESGVVNDE
mgnify:CR=1 FL=1